MNTETTTPHPVGSSAWLGADKMSVHWPPSYRGRIPVKVRMACDLGPDMWGILGRGTPRHWVKNNNELREAIPPAYTEYIGRAIIPSVKRHNIQP